MADEKDKDEQAAAQEAPPPEESTEVVVQQDDSGGDDDGQAQITADLDAANARAEAAEARAKAAEDRARAIAGHLQSADTMIRENKLATISAALENAQGLEGQLKAQLRAAKVAGDIDAEVEIQSRMAKNSTDIMVLSNGKQQLEAQPVQQMPQEPVYTAEAVAAQLRTPQSKAWIMAHPEWATSAQKIQKMVGAHNLAVGDGMAEDSPEYFAHIERTLGIGSDDRRPAAPPQRPQIKDQAPVVSQAAEPVRARSAPPAAPPSRGDSGGRIVRLTAQQREAAKISGVSEQEYAKNLFIKT
jgi:hypothetical protein